MTIEETIAGADAPPRYNIKATIETAWNWHQQHPKCLNKQRPTALKWVVVKTLNS
jgi:hypothetical protein